MKNFLISGTATTPSIQFDAKAGYLEIKGRSIPENSVAFYLPLYSVLDEYIESNEPKQKLNVIIQLEYYNSSSSVCVLNVLKKLEALAKSGTAIKVKWVYEEEDEDTLNSGKNFEKIINLPFEMVKI